MSDSFDFVDVGMEKRNYLRRRWREENITTTRREFSVLSREIGDLLGSDQLSEEQLFKLFDNAHEKLSLIRPYYPVIEASEVRRYEIISARFQAWQRALDHGLSPRIGEREVLTKTLEMAPDGDTVTEGIEEGVATSPTPRIATPSAQRTVTTQTPPPGTNVTGESPSKRSGQNTGAIPKSRSSGTSATGEPSPRMRGQETRAIPKSKSPKIADGIIGKKSPKIEQAGTNTTRSPNPPVRIMEGTVALTPSSGRRIEIPALMIPTLETGTTVTTPALGINSVATSGEGGTQAGLRMMIGDPALIPVRTTEPQLQFRREDLQVAAAAPTAPV